MRISKKKREQNKNCCAYACYNKPNERKGGLCHKHYARLRKELDPVYDRYSHFKHNALKRNKEFTITLIQFRFFCHNTGYILEKGKRGKNATVDRIDNRYGYHLWNIQLLTNRQNIKKYYEVDRYLDDVPF